MAKPNEANASVSRARVVLSQVVACLALDFLLMGLGMSISFVTVVLPDVIDAEDGISLTKAQASWFGSMAYLCQPLGSIFSGPLLDYFGRKKALFLVNIPHLVAWLLMYYSWDVPSLFIANALLGIGTGIMEAPSVTYVGEVSDYKVRGILTTLTNAFTSTGAFLAYLLGSVLPWRQAALISLTVPFVTMGLVLLAPETPIWLLSKGRDKEALHSLRHLRGWANPEDVQKEFDELVQYNDLVQQCVLCIKEGKTMTKPCEHSHNNIIAKTILKLKHVFLEKETSRPFTLVMAYFFFHSICGLAPIRPNMINICKALGMEYDSRSIVIATGAVFIALNLLSAIIVKLIGKRKLILIALLAAMFSSLSISIYAGLNVPKEVFSYDVQTFTDKKELLPVVLFMFLVCSHSLGIPWVLLSEVFPFKTRGTATSLAAALSYVVTFISSKAHFNLEANFHLSGTFAIYAVCGMIGTIYLYFYLPETESKSLVEIEEYYKSDRRIFADDCFINAFRKKEKKTNNAVNSPILDR